tara:strand:+ start:934 stop:2610 length:1677 start_codon:yes stop_codon:yes gene_type:complete
MFIKKIKFILILVLLYQNPLYSKSNTSYNFDRGNLSNYLSGIIAYENKDNPKALNFYNSSKILLNSHDPFLKRYVNSLILENKIIQATNIVKMNRINKNTNFFEAYLLLIIDNIKKSKFELAKINLDNALDFAGKDRFNLAILESLRQYIFLFKENKIYSERKNFGKLSTISETFQSCYLGKKNTEALFLNLIHDNQADYTRYAYFYLSYLLEKNKNNKAKELVKDFNYINSTLLLSQAKSWIEEGSTKNFKKIFSCKNHNDLIAEFLFLIANLYSSENNFGKSNFYINLSNFLNPRFTFNLSLKAENYFLNKDYLRTKEILKNFKKKENFYYWYRLKKEAQIIAKEKSNVESLDYILSNFKKIENPNNKILFDVANFYKNSKKYDDSIKYYTKIIKNLEKDSDLLPDILYRRGGSYERIGEYNKADQDLIQSLKINPDDAYVLNYLAYSWLERKYKIEEAIEMLEIAYEKENNDPYIIDSIGWAYFLIDDYIKAEKFLRRAVELMPDDPIVNDHYGDILWKLERRIQARYFWAHVLKMDEVEEDMKNKINQKLIKGI